MWFHGRAIRFPGHTVGAIHQALELALHRRGRVRAMLLDLELGVDADIFEVALHQHRLINT